MLRIIDFDLFKKVFNIRISVNMNNGIIYINFGNLNYLNQKIYLSVMSGELNY